MKWMCAAVLCAAGLASAQVGPVPTVRIDAASRFQTIQGFGVNFNGTYFREGQAPLIDMLVDDLGATMFRLDPYGLTNWETLNDNDDPKVINWEYFNDRYSIPAFEASWAAARYLNHKGIRPFLTLSGTAPDWMMDITPPSQPGKDRQTHLKPSMYDEFAETAVSMLLYARHKARVDFEYFSPLNETDCAPREGPGVTKEEMPRLLTAIAKRMQSEGLGDVRLVVCDQCGTTADFFSPILATPEVMKMTGAMSLHSYGKESIAPQVERVRASKYPYVPVWLTEYGDLNDRDFAAANEFDNFSLTASERAIRALNEGATVALFWDAYDNFHEHDQRMTYYGLVKNTDHIYTPKKRYYAAKQLYHFVRPGAQRIALKADIPGLTAAAFYDGASDSIIVVGVKRGGPDWIRFEGAPGAGWEAWQTTREVNCAKTKTAGGSLNVWLPGDTVFTLVGKVSK